MTSICTVVSCNRPRVAKGLCGAHYQRQKKGHSLLHPVGRQEITSKQKIEEYSIPEPNTGCWLWLGAMSSGRYGSLNINGKTRRAHRVAYEEFVGPIPANKEIDHLCRNPACVNPEHLEPVSHLENIRRGKNFFAAMTHCRKGHPLSGANVYITPKGKRVCKECRKRHKREHRARRAAGNVSKG